jgi:hypothetical protein
MSNYHKWLPVKSLILIIALQYASPVNAQSADQHRISNFLADNTIKLHFKADTVGSAKEDSVAYLSAAPLAKVEKFDAELLANPEASIKKPQERRQLMGYLKKVTTDEDVSYNQSRTKFLYHLAGVFTKLRLYPLAMKCYLKTTVSKGRDLADTVSQAYNSTYMAVNAKDDSLVEKQALLLAAGNSNKNSKATTYKYITSRLDDGKPAVAYAMLFHVKQPVPGKRKIFVAANTGHTFITLIKYNVDSTYSSFSFGFYPKKRNLLSATPVEPTTSSVFKDDTDHQWDEVLGKFISKRRFDKILTLVKQYDHLEYHLSNNNCTDFGLKAAALAGIDIGETTGSWPLGHGNNPAVTGQSILEGNFNDADTGKAADLFINTNIDK